jgi:hypothetical protein
MTFMCHAQLVTEPSINSRKIKSDLSIGYGFQQQNNHKNPNSKKMKKGVKIQVSGKADDQNKVVEVKDETTVSGNNTTSSLKVLISGYSGPISIEIDGIGETGQQHVAIPAVVTPPTEEGQSIPTLEVEKPVAKDEKAEALANIENRIKELNSDVQALKFPKSPEGEKAVHSLTQPVAATPLVKEGEQEKWKKEENPGSLQDHAQEKEEPWYKRDKNLFWKILAIILTLLLIFWMAGCFGSDNSSKTSEKETIQPVVTPTPVVKKDTVYNLADIVEQGARIHSGHNVYGVELLDGYENADILPILQTLHQPHKQPLETNRKIRSATVFANGNEIEYEFHFYPDGKGHLKIVHLPTEKSQLLARYYWSKARK